MITCYIRYHLVPGRLDEFEAYAKAWIPLIEEYGGTHHGYFLPGKNPKEFPDPTFSFPGLGKQAPDNIGVALFSFPDQDSYERYKKDVADDPRCHAATKRFDQAPCFESYERSFLKPILPSG